MNDVEQFIDFELSSILVRLGKRSPWTATEVSAFLKRHCHYPFYPYEHIETFERYRTMAA